MGISYGKSDEVIGKWPIRSRLFFQTSQDAQPSKVKRMRVEERGRESIRPIIERRLTRFHPILPPFSCDICERIWRERDIERQEGKGGREK